ncbi:MAG: sulfonate transport system substrate-binding protein [Clostridia bacterium]|nr:sulfonate transport system substrate-binding protein [Clostridia bacterium]
MRKFIVFFLLINLLITGLYGCGTTKKEEGKVNAIPQEQTDKNNEGKVTIGIGYQSPTAQTWGALIMKNQQLYEKELAAKFPNKNFQIEWFNSPSGPPLTNNMIAGKLQIAFMGDMPLLINGEKGQSMPNYRSVFIAFDGKGKDGSNQAVMVPIDSDLKPQDLQGKTISTILGSSAHRMLLAALDKYGLTGKVNIVNQDVMVGMSSIEQKKIAAHATWEPYPTLMSYRKVGKVLIDGKETGVDYLDGVVADRNWAENNREYVVAFVKALIRAHQFIRNSPDQAAAIFAEESGYPLEVTKQMVKSIRFDAAIYEKDIKTLEGSINFLKELGQLKNVNLTRFIDQSYLEQAVQELGMQILTSVELAGEWVDEKPY